MNIEHINTGLASDTLPESDVVRQAVDSLRGYVYQALATALAWLDIEENGRIYLEVAEDYAILTKQALHAVQIKDTGRSGSVTLNSRSVQSAITAFVDLVEHNPNIVVELRFFTTSEIGTEKAVADRPAGIAGLEYWRKVAAGADPEPLRAILESDRFPDSVRDFSKARDNEGLRLDLVKKIHWDCGKPDFQTLREELENRLVVVGRDLFQIPAPEALKLVDYLVYQVLEKSTVERPQDRVLTRSQLYRLIDAVTRVSMPRSAVEDHARIASELITSRLEALLGASWSGSNLLTTGETGWLVEDATLPASQGMIARVKVESEVTNALENFGTAILVGGTGLGKSVVSRAVGDARGCGFFMVDFRNTNEKETRVRLDMVFARIGGLPPSILILEDLNHFEDPQVSLSLARVIEALHRGYRKAIITCHRQPYLSALTTVGLDQGCIVECPYFSEEEACMLVSAYRGDPKVWGRLAHRAGGFGHPQLTHAFVNGMAAQGWPIDEIQNILSQGLSSDDIDAACYAARRNLVSALPEDTRTLLYRLSLTVGRFDRSLALTLGKIFPSISRPGESMDQLIGPWIEAIGNDLFRVSPLVRSSGGMMLAPDEQWRIHEAIAAQMVGKSTIDANDVDVILMHAMLGKSAMSLTIVAHLVLSADSRTLENLAEHMLLFRFIRTGVPIFPENTIVSGALRIAQFRLAAAGLDESNIPNILAALFDEVGSMPEGEPKRALEYMALITVLATMGIANHLDDWVALLIRLETMLETNDFLKGLAADVEGADGAARTKFFGGLFSIGSANITGVNRLEHIIDQLDGLDASRRALLLTPIDETQSDYSSFINGPWVASRHGDDFDAADSAMRYRHMAEKTRNWGIRSLSLQCSVAQAIMLDEYRNDTEGALAVLEESVTAMGDDRILSRAKAKIYWRHDEHDKALAIFRAIVDQVGIDSPVERAFALREAAISAASCGEWQQAEEWFLDAQGAAKSVQGGDMDVMAIGLGADSAVAALEIGNADQALTRLAEALEALSEVNPESTLRAAHCHRIIRRTVLWMQSRIQGRDVRIGGQPIRTEAGACSNPDPLPAIQQHPLGHIDIAWYMLAEAEIAASLDRGITSTLEDRLEHGPIPSLEFSLCRQAIQMDIGSLDAVGFSSHFISYIETAVFLRKEGKHLGEAFNPLTPERRPIPTLDLVPPFDPEVERVAKDAVLAYGVHSALTNQGGAIGELEAVLGDQFSGFFPGRLVFNQLHGNAEMQEELDKTVVRLLGTLLQDDYLEPYDFWVMGLRFFEWINQSNFRIFLTPRLSAWQRAGWRRILTKERVSLSRPMLTVPPIEEVLANPTDNGVFVAKLLLVTSDAVGSRLGWEYRKFLKGMTEQEEPSPNPAHTDS